MILLVARRPLDGPHADAFGDETRRVEQFDPADPSGAELPEVVVLDWQSLPDPAGLVRGVRSAAAADPRVPLVCLVEEPVTATLPFLGYDAVLQVPTTAEQVAAAVDRGRTVTEYRRAVGEFYDRCVERADEDSGVRAEASALRTTREEADSLFAELADVPGLVASLLWDPETDDSPPGFRNGTGVEQADDETP